MGAWAWSVHLIENVVPALEACQPLQAQDDLLGGGGVDGGLHVDPTVASARVGARVNPVAQHVAVAIDAD
jgi:hypothetical protein